MSGRQVTLVECVLLLSGVGVLSVVVRASRMARDLDVAQSIDALLDCLKPDHGDGTRRSSIATPLLVPKPDRRRFPRPQIRREVARPKQGWPSATGRSAKSGSRDS
jgi:hypothetical protein